MVVNFDVRMPESFEREHVDHYLGMLKKAGLVERWRVLLGPTWEVSFCPDYSGGLGGRAALRAFLIVLGDIADESPISDLDQMGLQGMFHPESGMRIMDL